MRGPNVFTIAPGAPFLPTLVAALLDGRLIEGFSPHDPFALADVTLYLPTRRAARAIRESFLDQLGRPVLLPTIRTLGDIDEDDLASDGFDPVELPPAVSPMERQLVLTRLVLGWSGALVRAAAELPDEELVVPASPADAARLAATLARLIDQVGVTPEAWAGLRTGMPADLARYWEITLEFLKIATSAWPDYLAEKGLLDPGARRDLLIRAEARRLAERGAPGPVIAAGSTGSVPATAALLAAIARLPNGAVVLPGLDQSLDAPSWAEVGPSEREPAGAGHPQFGLKKLLEQLGLPREEVQRLGDVPVELADRNHFVSESMRPASTTERWSQRLPLWAASAAPAVAGTGIVEAANEREEALTIAVLLRETAEFPGRVAALVTPDRALARRVAVELMRWGIDVDDSAGASLAVTPPGVLARLVAEAALGGGDAARLLALLKHPLAAFGMPAAIARRAARSLERAILRGPRLEGGFPALRRAVEHAAAERWRSADDEAERPRRSEASRGLSRADWAEAAELAEKAERAIAPLDRLFRAGGAVPFVDLVAAHSAAVEATARDKQGSPGAATGGEAGEALAAAFEELLASAPSGPDIAPRDYPGLLSALIERSVVRRRGGLDPRIHIWGALEARLQSVDTIVLGGLNEGTWPGRTRLDPLLSRPMRAALALEPPERRIGLAAHDFAQALGHREVWLTRADRQDGEPRTASRWLQRLTAYAGESVTRMMRERGAKKLALARRLDSTPLRAAAPRPRPSPPAELRPRRLSATQIETLIRDPYAVYARHVLKLRPFDPLAKLPDAAERGTLIHAILEGFIRERPLGPFDAAATEHLLALGRDHFASFADFPEIAALWWPRFERIARWFVTAEAARQEVSERTIEGWGTLALTPEFELVARADRLDRLTDGRLAVIDYKSGTPPSVDEVLSLAPQLLLEALIAEAGGFENIPAGGVARLEYYHLSGRGEGGVVHPRGFRAAGRGKAAVTLPEAIATTERRLRALVATFALPEAEYLSRKIPRLGRQYVGDYDHLARVAEWSVAETGDDDGAPQP